MGHIEVPILRWVCKPGIWQPLGTILGPGVVHENGAAAKNLEKSVGCV